MGLSVTVQTMETENHQRTGGRHESGKAKFAQPVASAKAAFSRPSSRAMLRREDNCLCRNTWHVGHSMPFHAKDDT